MKKLLIATASLTALALAAPAAAQSGYQTPYNPNPYNNGYNNNNGYGTSANAQGAVGIDNRLARLDARIQAGVQSGAIDQREARNLRYQLRQIERLDRQYGRDGYSQAERTDMQNRLRAFRDQLRMADGGNGYGNGNGQYGSNNNYDTGYGQSGYNNGYQGQGGQYEAYCDETSRGGIGGLIDSLFGGGTSGGRNDDCSTTLRVGSRVTGNLGGVPYEYRNQYRDGSGYYYRSDGRAIYQIDARTSTVVRAYPMNR
jgi:hypothetical protein